MGVGKDDTLVGPSAKALDELSDRQRDQAHVRRWRRSSRVGGLAASFERRGAAAVSLKVSVESAEPYGTSGCGGPLHRCEEPDASRNRRRRAGGLDARASAAPARASTRSSSKAAAGTTSIERVRAGVLEQGTVDLHARGGRWRTPAARRACGTRGSTSAFAGVRHRIDMAGLTGGRAITIYGQNEVVKDLIAARGRDRASVAFRGDGRGRARTRHAAARGAVSARRRGCTRSACDVIAGCDGSHGVCRPAIPPIAAADVRARVSVRVAWYSRRARRRRPTSWSTASANAASRCSACVRRRSRACTCNARRTRTSTSGATIASGQS